MKPEDAEEYTQALAQVGAGWWRQIALGAHLGVPDALGMSLEAWRTDRLGGLVLKSIPERRDAAVELAADGFSQRETAAILGVDQATVSRDLRPDASASPKEVSVEVAAESEPRPDASASDHSGMPARQEVADEILAGIDAAVSRSSPEINDGDEWYTPQWLFDALGIKFAIDVCAPFDLTHTAVPAARYFTIEDDGLAQPWDGTVWCNPPYSRPEPWARRMIHHRDGLLLTHMPMNAGWCVDTWEACDAIRLFQAMEFVRPDGSVQRPGYWLQLAAFGPVAIEGLARLQPLGDAAANKRRIASPMWRRA